MKKYQQEWYKKNKERLKEKRKQYWIDNRDRIKEERKQNQEKILLYAKEYREKHRERINNANRKYAKANSEKLRQQRKKYYKANRELIKEKQKKYANSPAKFDLFINKICWIYECRRDPDNENLLQIRCTYDGIWFNPSYQQMRDKVRCIEQTAPDKRTHGGHELYCSDACKEACPIYGQLKYPKGFKPSTSREVPADLRKMVLERDNWTCMNPECKLSKLEHPELELHCHHIDPVINNPIESADIDNCITLCKECHINIHKNTPGCSSPELRCK